MKRMLSAKARALRSRKPGSRLGAGLTGLFSLATFALVNTLLLLASVSERARVMFFFTPASPGMERFFPAFAEVPGDGPVQEEFVRLGSEAGMEVVGPPLAQSHPAPSVRG